MTEKLSLKSPGDFPNNDAWRTYVRQNVPQADVDYVLARGRTTLFVRFYETRKQPFPESFQTELLSIDQPSESDRAAPLEASHDRTLAALGKFSFPAPSPTPG